MSREKLQAVLKIAFATFMFGTVGIFRRNISLPSGMLAMMRGIIGTLLLLAIKYFKTGRLHISCGREKYMLALSGALIGFNWILLFEAYSFTSVSIVTMCYYMQPIIVTLASPFITHSKLTRKALLCSFIAIFGMILVSDVLNAGISSILEIKGILLGLAAAVLYAAVIFMNQSFDRIDAIDKTIAQLFSASICILPYVLLKDHPLRIIWTRNDVVNTLLLGVFVTGFAYAMYFAAMKHLSAVETASFSYIDPVTALFLSALFLNESMSLIQIAGAIMILASTLFSQLPSRRTTIRLNREL